MTEREIFSAALHQPTAAERAAYLDAACAGDAALRQRVESLLAEHERLGSFMDLAFAAVTTDRPATEIPGAQIGPYKLLQQIGEGGMGTVWMAQQSEPVKRLVALKLIKAGMDSRQVIARFEAERQALALMDHPNIAKVLDAGTVGPEKGDGSLLPERPEGCFAQKTPVPFFSAGRPYFVMELVRGIPITQYCDENSLPVRQRLELFVPVCQAVQHAHQKGIIHRDLKPSNVLVALYDGKPVPKVIDFGVAKATGQSLTDKTLVTGFGNIVGTLEYMSPEQAEFNQLDIDTRSDIYSLGVLLYELLAGSPPFSRKELERAGMLEMLRVIREQEPSKPSTKLSTADGLPTLAANRGTEPAKLTKLVRGELDWIVMKALEKDRNRRYETANGFAMDVQRYLADEQVHACPPSAGYRLRKFVRRNKGRLLVASALGVALLFAVGSIGWAVRDRAARDAAVAQERANREAELKREGEARRAKVAGQIDAIFDEVDRLEKQQKWPEALATVRRAEAAVAGGEADASTTERVRQRLKDLEFIDRLEQIRMEREWGVRWQDTGEYARAFRDYGVNIEELAVEASIERLKARPGLVIPLAAALDDWVYLRRLSKGDAAAWKRLVDVACGIDPEPLRNRLRSTWAQPVSQTQTELRRLAESINVREHPPATLSILANTLQQARLPDAAIRVVRDAQDVYPEDYWLNLKLGSLLYVERDFEGATRFNTVAAALRPHSFWGTNNLAASLREQGKLDEAVAVVRRNVELHPKRSEAYLILAGDLRRQGKLDEAVTLFRKAIELDPNSAHARLSLGMALRDQKKTAEANAAFDKASELDRKASELDPKSAEPYRHLGIVLLEQGKLDEAIDAFRKANAIDPKLAGLHLGNALRAQGKLDEAIDVFRKAIEADPENPQRCRANLGSALSAQKKWDEAVAVYREAIELEPKEPFHHFGLGNALRGQKKLDDAVAAYRRCVEFDPKISGAYINLGNALLDQNKLDEAAAAYRRAIELDQKYSIAAAYNNLAEVLWKQNKLEEATSVYGEYERRAREAFRQSPDNAQARDALALWLHNWAWVLATDPDARKRDPGRAVSLAQEAAELTPKEGLRWRTLGVAQYRAGNWTAARAALDKSIELGFVRSSNQFCLAMVHWQLGEKDKAREWYDRAVRWMDKILPQLTAELAEESRRFRAEAAELLELNEKKQDGS